jgi:hypothetical protein
MRRRIHKGNGGSDAPYLAFVLIPGLIIIGVAISFTVESPVHKVLAQEKDDCQYIYVKSAGDKFVELYSDSSLTDPIPNPFIVWNGHGKWELHTAGVSNLKIEERPCR